MKAILKRLGAAIMAVAMVASLTPVTGAAVFADETETDVPSVSEETTAETKKKTEKPSETSKETKKEPEETEVAETGKIPEASASSKKKHGPAQIVEKISASLDESSGVLTIKRFGKEACIDIQIAGVTVEQFDYSEEDSVNEFKINVKEAIDKLISNGDIVRQDTYSIWLIAYDVEIMLATWSGKITYDSKVSASMNGLSAKIENGILKWKNIKGTTDIYVFISDYRCLFFPGKTSLNLNEEIEWLIRSGYIENTGSFPVRIVFFNEKAHKNIASWSQTYEYKTDVYAGQRDTITGMNVDAGILKFNKIEDADDYRFVYISKEGNSEFWGFETNQLDINQYISELVSEGSLPEQSRYIIRIQALKYGLTEAFDDPLILAEGTYEYDFEKASNPLKVSGKTATVKYKKLRRKKQTLSAGKAIAGLGTARGKLTYTKVYGSKKISVSKSTGKITVKKGLKKKTYKVTVKISAAGNYGYDPSEVLTVTFKIKVK